MPTLGWDSQAPAPDSDKDEQPPQKGDPAHASPADASPKPAPKPAQEPPKPAFDAPRLSPPTFNFPTLSDRSMPHRVDPYPHHRRYEYDRRPSPPPITTLTHSPTTSVSSLADRSAVSTPPIRRSPPHSSLPAPHMYSPYAPDPMRAPPPHFRPEHLPHAYMYAPPPPHPMDHRPYEHAHDGPQQPYHPPPMMVPPMHGRADPHYAAYPPQQGAPVFTDDAATKLSERVRRRCFNCCTTDTSTWRRSNLSPGKVLCNKCGLFERTHSRPRPEQFPHKRGPLSSSTLRARTPPPTTLPPLSPPPAFHYSHPHYAPHPRDFPSPPAPAAPIPPLQTWPQHDSPKPPARRDDAPGPPSTTASRAPTPPASRPASTSTQDQGPSASAAAAAA